MCEWLMEIFWTMTNYQSIGRGAWNGTFFFWNPLPSMDRSETPPVPDSFTDDYFASFRDLSDLPAPYHRNIQERIFVTRDLNMNSINYVGCTSVTLLSSSLLFDHSAYN